MIDELTDKQLAELKQSLDILTKELEVAIISAKEQSQPVDLDLPIGRLSRIDAIQQKKMAEAQRNNTEVRLQQVNAALIAFKNDEYGWCRLCECPIGYPRLRARPETPFCLDCQSERERR